jgi:hypothetical protein
MPGKALSQLAWTHLKAVGAISVGASPNTVDSLDCRQHGPMPRGGR